MSFRLFGFPVRIEGSFLLVVGLLGYSASVQIDRVIAFVAIAVLAVSDSQTMFDPGPIVYMEKIAVGPDTRAGVPVSW